MMVFHWSSSDSKSSQVSRTLLSILTDLNNTVVWMALIHQNTLNLTTVGKLFILDRNTWNYTNCQIPFTPSQGNCTGIDPFDKIPLAELSFEKFASSPEVLYSYFFLSFPFVWWCLLPIFQNTNFSFVFLFGFPWEIPILSQDYYAPESISSFNSVMLPVGIFINNWLTFSVSTFIFFLSWFLRNSNTVFFSVMIFFINFSFFLSSCITLTYRCCSSGVWVFSNLCFNCGFSILG